MKIAIPQHLHVAKAPYEAQEMMPLENLVKQHVVEEPAKSEAKHQPPFAKTTLNMNSRSSIPCWGWWC
jgi:hypothetical protein